MTKFIHTMLRVRDLDASVDFYAKSLGMELRDKFVFDGFTLAYLGNSESEAELELTMNHNQSQPYHIGEGYGHVAVSVEDLEATRAGILDAGIEAGEIKTLSHNDGHLATFFFIQDPDGYRIEFIQRQGRYL